MQLTVKTLKGIKFVIDIDPTCTIAEVKTVIVSSSSSSSSSKTVMIIIIFTIEPFDVYFDIIYPLFIIIIIIIILKTCHHHIVTFPFIIII